MRAASPPRQIKRENEMIVISQLLFSCPRFFQKKIAYISMPDATAATIKFIQRNYIFGIVIPDLFQHTELTFYFLSL